MIEFKNVSKTYSTGTHALNGVDISIESGEFVFIVGPSGSGKSTFLKLIMREELPTRGDILIDDESLNKMKRKKVPYMRRKMGIVFQEFRLIDKMTVFENVAFAMRVIGASNKEVKERVPYILGLVGLDHKAKSKPCELSGGEQQRVSLARALINNPKIIIADEPTGNVDPLMSHEIIELLSEINKMGTTVLIVTHEHDLVSHFGKRIIEINQGKVVNDSVTDFSSQISLITSDKLSDELADKSLDTEEKMKKILDTSKYDELLSEIENEYENANATSDEKNAIEKDSENSKENSKENLKENE